jgi:diadenosine tetraphosphate (Ap4A) HIT family hydrolase
MNDPGRWPEDQPAAADAGSGGDACPFCDRLAEPSDLPRSERAAVIRNAFPRARGHLLVVPVMHVADYFDVPGEVKAELWTLVESARAYLLALYKPAGWTVRINVGRLAGQTVHHAHIHVVPHYAMTDADHMNNSVTGVQ